MEPLTDGHQCKYLKMKQKISSDWSRTNRTVSVLDDHSKIPLKNVVFYISYLYPIKFLSLIKLNKKNQLQRHLEMNINSKNIGTCLLSKLCNIKIVSCKICLLPLSYCTVVIVWWFSFKNHFINIFYYLQDIADGPNLTCYCCVVPNGVLRVLRVRWWQAIINYW